ncbi:MAG: O-antigen ligase family protein, partial [Alphaproteobacteria bacterium]
LAIAPRKLAIPMVLFAITLAWILVQLAPFTPSSWHHPIWREAAAALKTELVGRITIDAYRTATGLTRLLWYAGIFWLALQTCRDGQAARRAFNALAIAAFAYAVYGLVIQFSGLEMVLWTQKAAYRDSLTSTFINRNSYASYAGIGLICMTAVIARRLADSGIQGDTIGVRLINGVNLLVARNWHVLFAWVVILTALILSNSRAGLVSSVLGLFAFLGAMTLSRTVSRKLSAWFAGVTMLAIAAFFLVSGDFVTKRFAGTGETEANRLALYELTLGAIGDSPVLGMGFGTFSQVFQLYRSDIPQFRIPFVKAHNTYLENALELGIPAASTLTLSVLLLAVVCFLGARRRRRDAVFPAVAVGASVLVGFHSLVDFSLQIPGVAVTYFFVLGIGCAQSWSSRERSG